jgi:hypothetical protein
MEISYTTYREAQSLFPLNSILIPCPFFILSHTFYLTDTHTNVVTSNVCTVFYLKHLKIGPTLG